MPVNKLWTWSVSCGEGEVEGIWHGMDKICVVVAAEVRLDDCKEVPRPKEGEVANVIAVGEERGFVEVILDDIKEPVSGRVRVEMRFVEMILGDMEGSATAD